MKTINIVFLVLYLGPGMAPTGNAQAQNGAQYVSQSAPSIMQPGEKRVVSITIKNAGMTTWTQAGQYKLGVQSPQDNTLWVGGTRIYLEPNETIAPGQSQTFGFEITAPHTPGTYDFQWRMVQDGVEWFGEFTPLTKIMVFPDFPVRPGLWPASSAESSDDDLDGDGLPQSYELQLAQAFLPTIWFDNGEDNTWPGGNSTHGRHQPGRMVFRVRPHPQNTDDLVITYAMLFGRDGGEGPFPILSAHPGDVETFAITLVPSQTCDLGYKIFSIRTWAHQGVFGFEKIETSDTLTPRCKFGFSVDPVGKNDIVLVSENKHGSYLREATCDNHLAGGENCNLHFTMGDVNAWVGLNSGEPNAQLNRDLGPLGFPTETLWAKRKFCGAQPDTIRLVNGQIFYRDGCPGPVEEKLDLFAPAAGQTLRTAKFFSQTVPTQMQTGEKKTVSIAMFNFGNMPWTAIANYRLGSQNPQDNTLWTGGTRIDLDSSESIGSGQAKTFTFDITAPTTPGTYNFQWCMLKEGVEWFGDFTPNVAITVVPKPAYKLAASPSSVASGGQLTVNWTAPAGSSVKDWVGLYKVGAPGNNFLWWQYTQGKTSGSITINAPTTPGQYEFRYFLNDGFTEAVRSNMVTVNASTNCWTEDLFDNLPLGSLAGQNGWSTVTGSYTASVVNNPSGMGKVLQLDPPPGTKVVMAKSLTASLSGAQSLELKVRVEQPGSASMAKIEVNTNNNTFGGKKFQLYFGSSMRLNNSPTTAINFVSQAVPQRWYQIKVVFDLGANIADLYLDGVLVLNDVAIAAGPITGIAVTGFDAPGYVLLDDVRGCADGLVKISASGHDEEIIAVMPSSLELTQNYPNPFWSEATSRFAGNPETVIQYSIPGSISSPAQVTLRIYNIHGQLVRTLVNEQKSPGYHRVIGDGKNDAGIRVASGAYLSTLSAGEFKATKRMTILK